MITGTGIDIVEIDRIKKAVKRWGKHFLDHVFCESELEYAKAHKFANQHLAVRFAAKEAVFKAAGGRVQFGWKDIEIKNDAKGKPYCVVHKKGFKKKIHLSLSHCKNYAVASAIITS